MKLYSKIILILNVLVHTTLTIFGATISRSIPTGCTSPAATFCSVSANCIEAGTILATNEIVSGTITAGTFATPSGPLVTGIQNYGVLLSSSFSTSGDGYIQWQDTPPSNLSAGITLDPSTGFITLPVGLFLVQYTVKFQLNFGNSGSGFAILAQGPAGGPLVLLDSPPIAIMGTSGTSDGSNSQEPLVTGYALISVPSTAENTIGLNIQLFGNITLAPSQGDENAELVILQLR